MTTDQPVGEPLSGWTARQRPSSKPMQGQYCIVERLNNDTHGNDLFSLLCAPESESGWTYQRDEQPKSRAEFDAWIVKNVISDDPMFHAIVDRETSMTVGVASFMRMDLMSGVIEVGHIHYAPSLRRTPAGTEAIYLMMRRVFDELGYRRCEWKRDSLNSPSRRAAERYGFAFEGIFRQAVVYKNRSRDTAWFSALDRDWPRIKCAFESWLDPSNFDRAGRQRRTLALFR